MALTERSLLAVRRLSVIFIFALSAIILGCSNSDSAQDPENTTEFSSSDTSSPSTTGSAQPVGPWVNVSDASDRPSIVVIPDKQAPTDLAIRDIRVGVGNKVEAGDVVEVHYVGALLADGAEFDASWNRSETFFVPIGVGAVIPGWDQGIIGMQEGGRRVLVIPPRLAYGTSGAGGAIPPNAELAFVVDLLSVVNLQPPSIPENEEVGSSLEIRDLAVGEGAAVEAGDKVTVHYLGTLADGTVFDASWRRGTPFTTTIGVGMVIQGWDQGIIGMREGGRRLLKIPSDLAYGETGSGASIPPDTPLLFVVDLMRIQNNP